MPFGAAAVACRSSFRRVVWCGGLRFHSRSDLNDVAPVLAAVRSRGAHASAHARYVDEALAIAFAEVIRDGIHDPATMPFDVPWTDEPSPDLERNSLRHWWRTKAETNADHWALTLAVIVEGQCVGATSLVADDFPVLRTFETGSWLGRRFQGRGIGTEMRLASLQLGFQGLDARQATTTAFVDNAVSLAVTRRLGYEPNGMAVKKRRGEHAEQYRFRMSRTAWASIGRDDITLSGVGPCLELLGLTTT